MKKTVALLLALLMIVSLAACGKTEEPEINDDAQNEQKEEVPTPTKTKIDCFISEFRPYVVEPSDDVDSPSYLIVETKKMADKIYAESIQNIKNDYVRMVADVSETGHEEFISLFLEMHEGLVKTFAHFDETFFQNYKLFFVGLKRYGGLNKQPTVKAYIDPKEDVLYVDILLSGNAMFPTGPLYTTAAVWIDKEIAERYAKSMVIRNINE